MRIGFVLDGNFFNDSRVTNEAFVLADCGHEVYVINTTPGPSMFPVPVRENVFSISTSFKKKFNNILFAFGNILPFYEMLWLKELKKFVGKFNIEVLHAHDLYLARLSGKAARFYGIPLVLDLHENYPAAVMNYRWATRFPASLVARPELWNKKEGEYLSYADRLIVLSNEYRDHLTGKYAFISEDSVFVYPNVPDFEKLSSFPVNKDIFRKGSSKIILYFGVISKRRGINTAVKAVELLTRAGTDVHLLLIGPADKAERKSFSKLINQPHIKDHITHYTWKDISSLPSYITCSDICISPLVRNPQHDSGIANKVFQYMMFGRPLIVSDCLPQVALVETTGCGLVFRNEDADDLSSKITEILTHPEKALLMGENGVKAISNIYNTRVKGRELCNLYNSLG